MDITANGCDFTGSFSLLSMVVTSTEIKAQASHSWYWDLGFDRLLSEFPFALWFPLSLFFFSFSAPLTDWLTLEILQRTPFPFDPLQKKKFFQSSPSKSRNFEQEAGRTGRQEAGSLFFIGVSTLPFQRPIRNIVDDESRTQCRGYLPARRMQVIPWEIRPSILGRHLHV